MANTGHGKDSTACMCIRFCLRITILMGLIIFPIFILIVNEPTMYIILGKGLVANRMLLSGKVDWWWEASNSRPSRLSAMSLSTWPPVVIVCLSAIQLGRIFLSPRFVFCVLDEHISSWYNQMCALSLHIMIISVNFLSNYLKVFCICIQQLCE